jgi:O-antigen/teichoic acid export membrane protein
MAFQETRRFINNLSVLTIGYFFVRLLTMIATLYAARALGPNDFGGLSSGINIAIVFGALSNLGLSEYLVFALARDLQERNLLLGNAILAKVILFPLALIGLLLFILKAPQSSLFFSILLVYSLLHSYMLLFWAVFRGLERMAFQTLLMTLQAVVIAVGTIVAIWLTKSVTVASAIYLIATALAVFVGYVLLNKIGIRPAYHWRPSEWKQLLATSLPFGLVFLYLLAYDRMPSILIVLLSGKQAAGWFNSVYNITGVLLTIPSIFVDTIFPLMARKSQQNHQNIGDISTQLIKYTTIVSLGLSIMLGMLAPWIVSILFGNDYSPSIWILQILALGIPFLFLSTVLAGIIQAVGQQGICARYIGYSMILAVPSSIFAVWQWGYSGGTLAYTISNAVLFIVLLILILRTIGNIRLGQAFFVPVLAALGGIFFTYVLDGWSVYFLLPLTLLIYLGILLLGGAVGAFEKDMIHKIWQSWEMRRHPKPSIHPVGHE